MTRRSRSARRPGVRLVLGPRDQKLLHAVARFRIATTGHIVRLFFQGVRRDTAIPRLRKLYDAALLDIVSAPVNGENVYAVGTAGRRWLEDRGVTCNPAPRGPLDHHLAIVDAWVGLAIALHGNAAVRLARFSPDWECRGQLAGSRALVVPDAAITLSLTVDGQTWREVGLSLEVDLGTERQGALAGKLTAYASERFADGVGLAVVLVDAGERRAEAVRRLVGERWPSWSVVCRRSEWPDTLLARLTEQPLPPLTGSPDGQGRMSVVTPSVPAAPSDQGEGHSR